MIDRLTAHADTRTKIISEKWAKQIVLSLLQFIILENQVSKTYSD